MLTIAKLVMRSRLTFERRSGKFPTRCWKVSLQTSTLNVRVTTVIQSQGARIEHISNYWAVLAKWWWTRKTISKKLMCLQDKPI